ncbi:MAG TPA: hypothetical protein VFK69_03830 [Candidatus Eisenbacteria bacterium]|nr:hypothetical protein [Candidatus Eisenbacteria bacterium]
MSTFRRICHTFAAAALLALTAVSAAAADCNPAPDFLRAPVLSTQTSASKTIVGALGGVVQVGRYTLLVPPGAIRGTAVVTVNVPDPAVMRCDLSISPASANGFTVPVVLVANVIGVTDLDPSSLATLWFDPQQGCWVTMPSSVFDAELQVLRTPLWHFSSYGTTGGRAGW